MHSVIGLRPSLYNPHLEESDGGVMEADIARDRNVYS
jgi:hypothetical protein